VPYAAILVFALALSLVGTLVNLSPRTALAAPARPNIVMFYMDDFSPYPARLWNSTERTPELAKFANHGIEFTNAHASTPLCGPARANLLTGMYGHNSGVTQNRISAYTGRRTVATRLRTKGYRTAFVGKHINGLARTYPTRSRMATLSKRWDQFDVIWQNQGRFYDWRQYRKDGTRSYGRKATDHSSYQAAMRAVRAIKTTPRSKPLFLIVSLYDGHIPLTPLPRFKNHPKCRYIKDWKGPAYNELDVSDKPAYIRRTPRRLQKDFNLQARCEQAMTVDWVVRKVRLALQNSGRINDTLQVLTSDNGYLLGDHRLVSKPFPYSSHVLLQMRWLGEAGRTKRVVTEPVSNVDFGKTFCALAGCAMPTSDGKSLLPLILGKKNRLERKFIYTENLHSHPDYGKVARAYPGWIGIHSTLSYSNRLWSFTRYQTGEEELYDRKADPHMLVNLAKRPAYADVLADMRGFWRSIRNRDGVKFLGNARRG